MIAAAKILFFRNDNPTQSIATIFVTFTFCVGHNSPEFRYSFRLKKSWKMSLRGMRTGYYFFNGMAVFKIVYPLFFDRELSAVVTVSNGIRIDTQEAEVWLPIRVISMNSCHKVRCCNALSCKHKVAEWIAKLKEWGMLTSLNNQKQTTLGMNRGFFDHYKKSF